MSTRMQLDWGGTMRQMTGTIGKGKGRLRNNVNREMSAVAAQAQATVRGGGHPWQNRTGQAERTFTVVSVDSGQRITIRHGVFWGYYLEAKNGGKYGVIDDVMRELSTTVREGLQRAVNQTWP